MTPIEFNESAVIDKLVYSVDRYIFYNETISDNIVYLIQDGGELEEKLLNAGFKLEEFYDNIHILYK